MATQRRNALGRGLDALLSMEEVKTEGSSSINEIELSKISVNPNQPRREFDETALEELADSIREIGIIQPITLRKVSDDEYQIIGGERRYRASQKAGLDTIPAYIRTADDENVMEMALIENIQREDLNSVEIALAYQHLIEQYDLTQERLSERVGKKRTTIANYLRLLKLPAPIQMALQNKHDFQIVGVRHRGIATERCLLGRNRFEVRQQRGLLSGHTHCRRHYQCFGIGEIRSRQHGRSHYSNRRTMPCDQLLGAY